MNEKVKLPRFVCDWLKQNEDVLCGYPMVFVSKLSRERNTVGDVENWLLCNTTNQWKLIDAIRYGYEAEPEPRWGIKAGNCYMRDADWTFTRILSLAIKSNGWWEDKQDALNVAKMLGFGEVVDLNKVGKADDSTE